MTASQLLFVGTFTPCGPDPRVPTPPGGIPCVDTPSLADSGLYAASFSPDSGALGPFHRVAPLQDPNFLVWAPRTRTLYTSGVEANVGYVHAFSVAPSGAVQLRNRVRTSASSDCHLHLTPDHRFLLFANYWEGHVGALSLLPDGSLGSVTSHHRHAGSGPNHERQEGPHAHGIVPSPDGRFAYASDLGADRIFVYELCSSGDTLRPRPELTVVCPAGSGPRHLVLSPDGLLLYAFDEMHASVRVYTRDTTSGRLTFEEAVSALPPDYSARRAAAEIVLHPARPTLYASNRFDHESIAVFDLEPNGHHPELIQHFHQGLHHPRHFSFDPTHRWMVIGNLERHAVQVVAVDPHTGLLGPTVAEATVPRPACCLVITL